MTPRTHLLPLVFTSLALLPLACGSKGTSETPEGTLSESKIAPGPGYGEELIGFRNSTSERALAAAGDGDGDGDGDSSAAGKASSAISLEADYSAASAGGSTAAFGSGGYPGSGGVLQSSVGGVPGIGGTEMGGATNDASGGTESSDEVGTLLPKAADPPSPVLLLDPVIETPFFTTAEESNSTFSLDVDSASYTLTRAQIKAGTLPEPEFVRIEEFLNYFDFHYQRPEGEHPLSVYSELGPCPWNDERELLLLGVQSQEIDFEDQPPLNLVYLLDVSGSMGQPLKLPLLQKGFRMLTRMLRPQDRVSIVTYSSTDHVILEGVAGSEKDTINAAINSLTAGGSTAGSRGIQMAYEVAQAQFIEGGSNRILLATDGDFNIGISDPGELEDFISAKRGEGIFLSVYGYGSVGGELFKDAVGEGLADHGDGVYFYIDGDDETRRAFGYAMSGSLMTVAKDVKLQVEFNPDFVKGYRLIGYENRVLSNDSFDNDSVDAGELGAGMSMTALYEIIRVNSAESVPTPLAGTIPPALLDASAESESEPAYSSPGPNDLAQIRLRYKKSDESESSVFRQALTMDSYRGASSLKFVFAAGISEFAMQLRHSQYLDAYDEEALKAQIERVVSIDKDGAVQELLDLYLDANTL